VSITSRRDSLVDDLASHLDRVFLIASEDILLIHEPGKHFLVQVTLQLFVHHAHAAESSQCIIFQADQVLFANDTCNVLLMSVLTLLLSSLLLVSTTLALSFDASLSSLESLCLNQLCIAYLLVLFLLVLHNRKLSLLENLHACLLKCFQAEHIEHRLDLMIEVE